MAYLNQVQEGMAELVNSLKDTTLRKDTINQKKTWIKHYIHEVKRLKNK